MRTTCPLTIVVMKPLTDGRVSACDLLEVHRSQAVIFRRSDSERKNPPPTNCHYYEPQGEYYIKLGNFQLNVRFTGNGFQLKLTPENFLRVFGVPHNIETVPHHG